MDKNKQTKILGTVTWKGGMKLDVIRSWQWPNGLFRIDLIGKEGKFAGQQYLQAGKNVDGYTAPDDGRDYVLIKDYAECAGMLATLEDAGIVDWNNRVFPLGHTVLYECTINDGTEREYDLPGVWEMSGTYHAVAKSMAEAVEQALSGPLPSDDEYVSESFDVDLDGTYTIIIPEEN